MKRSGPLKRDREALKEWRRTSKPLQRGNSLLKRTPLSPVGRRRERMRREGKSYGELADFVRQIGGCQAKGELPGRCGPMPGRTELEVCHAGTKGSGQYDWVTDADGERVGNLWLGCPVHHSWADGHKAESLEWMRETARENGELFREAQDER